jgi:ribonuclease HII
MRPDFSYERDLWRKGHRKIAGIDEAGRGPLAGPVVAASVILPRDHGIEGINDSKKLSVKKRELLYDEIWEKATDVGVFSVSNIIIDNVNILEATKLAMEMAVYSMETRPDYILVDGNQQLNVRNKIPSLNLIGGDGISLSIAAASIIAKVTRDRAMAELHNFLPIYGWDTNKGYGTKKHLEALGTYGPSPYHRKSFRRVMW